MKSDLKTVLCVPSSCIYTIMDNLVSCLNSLLEILSVILILYVCLPSVCSERLVSPSSIKDFQKVFVLEKQSLEITLYIVIYYITTLTLIRNHESLRLEHVIGLWQEPR